MAAIVPLKDVDQESLVLGGHPEFLDLVARSWAQFTAGQNLSLDEMKKAVLPRQKPNKHLELAAREPQKRSGLT